MADDQLEALWANVLANWRDGAAHGAFLDHCRTTGQLPEAAARYRTQTGGESTTYRTVAGDPEIARKQLNAIVAIALAEMQAARARRGDPVDTRSRSMLRNASFVLFLALMLAVAHMLRR